jgi:hypothetical protein
MKAQWGTQGELNNSQGGLSGPSPLRSDGSRDSQVGRLDYVNYGRKQIQGVLLKLGPLRSDGSQVSGLEDWAVWAAVIRHSKEVLNLSETTRLQ